MKGYKAYTPSEIPGVKRLPKQWNALKLKYLSSIQFSNVDKNKEEGEESVRLCNYVDVYHHERITPDLNFMEATASQREIAKFSLKEDDVLVTKDSESWDDIAVPAYVPSEIESTLCGYHLAQIRPNPDAIDGRYLFRTFEAQAINDQFKVAATGVTRFGLGKYWLDNALVPVPPLQDQRAIADFLDRDTAHIDELIAKKQHQIDLLQEKRAAVISHAVTKGLNPDAKMKNSGTEWLGEIPEHWEAKKIKYFAKILRGKFSHRPRNDPRLYDGPYPFIQTGDVSAARKFIREYQQTLNEDGLAVSKMFPKGTLVMTIAANIGDMAILDFPACFPDSIVGFVPADFMELAFLYYLLSSMRQIFLSTATLNTQLNINIDRIGPLWAVVPPQDEQKTIVSYLDREAAGIEALIDKILVSISVLNEYRSALISAAVTGEIDVRKEAAA